MELHDQTVKSLCLVYLFTGPKGFVRADAFAGDGRLPFETSRRGIFAISDVRAGSTKRVAAAVGEGAQLVATLHMYLTQAVRAGLGFSDRSLSGGTAIFSANRRSSTDETTQTQPLTGLQGPSGFGRHQGREDAGAAGGAL